MEIILGAVKIIIPFAVIIAVITRSIKIINATDLEKAFFTNIEAKMSKILNSIEIFVSNIFIILSLLCLVYGRFEIPSFVKKFFDIVIILIGCCLIITLIVSEFKIKKFGLESKLNNFVTKYKRVAVSSILIFIDLYAIVLVLNIALPSNLIEFNALAITMITTICSLISMSFMGVIRDVTIGKNKKAKFYFYREIKDNEKYYIYYSQDNCYAVCGECQEFELAKKLTIVPIKEIKENYSLYRIENN